MSDIDKKERFWDKVDVYEQMVKLGDCTDAATVVKEQMVKMGDCKDHATEVNEDMSRVKQLGSFNTRKRKRNFGTDSSSSSDKKYLSYYRKKKKLRDSSDGKDVPPKGPVVFSRSSNGCVHQFSGFVLSVLIYLRKPKVFSWRRFSSFLLLEPAASIFESNGSQLLLDSTFSKSNGFFKVFGSIKAIPIFSINFTSVPACFIYMHTSVHLKLAVLSDAVFNLTSADIEVPAVDSTRSVYKSTTILRLPSDVWDHILSTLDPIEIANLRCTSRVLRRDMTGDDFMQRFNAHHIGRTWSYVHIQNTVEGGPGMLVGVRWYDQTMLRNNIQGMLRLQQGEVLTLLSCAGSFFLFSIGRPEKDPLLCVINFLSQYLKIIDCPQPISGFDFSRNHNNIKFTVSSFMNLSYYEIIVCLLILPGRPVMCLYDSKVEDWIVIEEVTTFDYRWGGEIEDHNHQMFLMNLPFGDSYYVQMKDEGLSWKVNKSFQKYFTSCMSFTPELMETEEGWMVRIHRLYSKEGWAIAMLTHINVKDDLKGEPRTIIHDVKLYKITPDLHVHQHGAVFDRSLLQPVETLLLSGAITIECTHEMVQLAMVLSAGKDCWRIKYITLDFSLGKWAVSSTEPFTAVRVGAPVLTCGLTL